MLPFKLRYHSRVLQLSIKALGKVLALIFEDYDKKDARVMETALDARDFMRLVALSHAKADAATVNGGRRGEQVLGV